MILAVFVALGIVESALYLVLYPFDSYALRTAVRAAVTAFCLCVMTRLQEPIEPAGEAESVTQSEGKLPHRHALKKHSPPPPNQWRYF